MGEDLTIITIISSIEKNPYGFILVTYQFLVALIMQFSQVAAKGQQRSITEENEMKHAGRNKGSKDQQTTSN